MGKITCDAIKLKLAQKLKKKIENLECKGIDVLRIKSIESFQVFLSRDFQYEGRGEYAFSADIKFMIKEENSENDFHSEIYRVSFCKMFIEETAIDFEVEIVDPMILQKKN